MGGFAHLFQGVVASALICTQLARDVGLFLLFIRDFIFFVCQVIKNLQ